MVPRNMTHLLQPLDLTTNGSFKTQEKNAFSEYFTTLIKKSCNRIPTKMSQRLTFILFNLARSELFNLGRSELFGIRFRLPGSLALCQNSCFGEALLTLSQNINRIPTGYAQGVNGNEPIENMQLYMGYSPEKLKHRLGLN